MKSNTSTCNFIERVILAQVFSCEFCEIFKNTFFTEHLRWLFLKFTSTYNKGLKKAKC